MAHLPREKLNYVIKQDNLIMLNHSIYSTSYTKTERKKKQTTNDHLAM